MRHNIIILTFALAAGTALIQPTPTAAQATKPGSIISLNDFKNELSLLQNHITATADSLQQVKDSAKDEAALSKAAADFQSRFQALENHVSNVRTQAVVVKARAKEHFDSWQKELTALQSAKIREKAQERFTETRERFDKIVATAERAKEEVLPFVSELKDISLYLQTDLSQDAVKSLPNTIWKLGNRAKSANGSLTDVIEEIDRTIKSMPKQ